MSHAILEVVQALALTQIAAPVAEEGQLSTLNPAGPASAAIAQLWWWLLGTFSAVFLLVLALLTYAIVRRSEVTGTAANENLFGPNRQEERARLIIAGGIVLPVVVLTPLYFASIRTSLALKPPDSTLTVRVVGHMWWWEVRYPEQSIVTANEIHIPAGRPVRLELASADVIHSFWVPRLHGKRDMIPGIENVFWIQADEPGVYRGQCGEYCGTQHANMAFQIIALPPDEFDVWLMERSQTSDKRETPIESRGRQVFMTAGCAQCHAVRGTDAKGNAGPDLTHIGSRRALGAALIPHTRGALAGWITDPQGIKPGVKMPRSFLTVDDLQVLTEYLEGLQ